MEPPRLIEAFPRQLGLSERAPLTRASFRLTYLLEPLPGQCLLQRVETRIWFLRGEVSLASFEAVYWEYFRFATGEDQARLDRHDFSIHRDGWSPGRVNRLLHRHRLSTSGDGPTRLRFEKRFLIGPADVDPDAPVLLPTPAGGAFGYLAEAEGEPTRQRWCLRELELNDAALPLPGPAAGRGRFRGPLHLEAWERLEFGFATLSGTVERQGYQPFTRPTPLAEQPLL